MNEQTYYQTLVLHIPHASKEMPTEFAQKFRSEEQRQELLRQHTDTYTDELFEPNFQSLGRGFVPNSKFLESDKRIITLKFPYSRLYCDVERFPHDPLEEKGLGFLYDLEKLGWGNNYCHRDYRIYQNHRDKLYKILEKNHSEYYRAALVIDCHSFSREPNVLCSNPPKDVDICIGYNDDFSRPSDIIIDTVCRYFTNRGYRVARNFPFSNSKTFETPFTYHSLRIEICKSAYMNEKTEEKLPNFSKVHTDIMGLYARLIYSRIAFCGKSNIDCYVCKKGQPITGFLVKNGKGFGLERTYQFLGNRSIPCDITTLKMPLYFHLDNEHAEKFMKLVHSGKTGQDDEYYDDFFKKLKEAEAELGFFSD